MARACPFFSTMHRFNTFPFVLFPSCSFIRIKEVARPVYSVLPLLLLLLLSSRREERERDTRHDTNILYFIPVKYRSFPHSFKKNRYHVVLMELYLFFSSPL